MKLPGENREGGVAVDSGAVSETRDAHIRVGEDQAVVRVTVTIEPVGDAWGPELVARFNRRRQMAEGAWDWGYTRQDIAHVAAQAADAAETLFTRRHVFGVQP